MSLRLLSRVAVIAPTCVIIGVYLAVHEGVFGDWLYLTTLAGATALAWVGARRNRADQVSTLIAWCLTISTAADAIWQTLEWTSGLGSDVTVADVPWIASYFVLGAALLRTSGDRQRMDRDGMVDIAVVFLVALLVQWELVFDDIVTDAALPIRERVVFAIYPTLDAALLALVVRARLARRLQGATALFVAAGTVCWLIADFGYSLFANVGPFTVWMDIGWILGTVLLSAATWQKAMAPAHREVGPENTRSGGIAVALVPLLVPGAVALICHLRDDPENTYLIYGVSVMLVALAFTRGARILHAEAVARALVKSQERYARAVAANAADAFVVLDNAGTILRDAPRLATLLGQPDVALVGTDFFTLVRPAEQDDARAVFQRCLTTAGQTLETEMRVQYPRGHQRWFSARMVNLSSDPDVGGTVVNLHDIDDRKRAEAELQHQAFHDGLTDLANRALFGDRVEHALRRNARTGLSLAVIFLDLDGFKNVNDSLGHGAGDQLLKEVASRLTSAVRTEDTVARLGGDEFAILIEQSPDPVQESVGIAERILQSLASPIELRSQAVTMSASFGIAASDPDSTASSLLRDADVAMYRAKTAGKAQWVVYDPEMRAAAVERLQLENDLIGALAADQFRLVYQPVVALETEAVVGFEALLRWHHPTLGLIEPERFIPIAEDTGHIVAIGRWVITEACATAARWHRTYPHHRSLSVAVNVSARQLASPDLVDHVRTALLESGMEAPTLVMEMTETALIQDTAVAAARLKELHAIGVRLAIDDFGTGYSSLSYLRQFPVDILKIDRAFIATITDRAQVPAIVRGLLDLGHTLELEIIAEGVECDSQRDHLRTERCDLAQGFLFSHPLDMAAAERLLASLSAPIRTVGA